MPPRATLETEMFGQTVAFGAGRILGIDAYLERTSVVQSNPWLKYLFGRLQSLRGVI